MIIEKNKAVTVHYTLKNKAGEVVDSSEGQEPLAYIQGIGNIVVGLEKQLEGKKVGDKLDAEVSPEEGYGETNDELIRTLPKEQFGDLGDVKVGLSFYIESPQGHVPATILEVTDKDISFDMNHPLAGNTLFFSVEVIGVRDATEEELEHGHVHGPGGHAH
ncbi:peptidylprolyl isomerase [Candidatus Marinamargulisbacteria bacterium SCGC AAA071-K20]|nr:peptidylprolyl isomerase [Candidatus Marinamargulisbacteria bacterium SCGC AAA071-K20]